VNYSSFHVEIPLLNILYIMVEIENVNLNKRGSFIFTTFSGTVMMLYAYITAKHNPQC